MLANHQCAQCLKDGLPLVLLHLYLLFSSLHMWNSGIYLFLLSVCCIFCCPHLSSILPCLVHPRGMTRLCFVLRPCKLLNISPSMFEYCVLWEDKCAIGWPRKVRCLMRREALVSVVSIWPRFLAHLILFPRQAHGPCCPVFLGGITKNTQVQQWLLQPDNNTFFAAL